MRKGAPSACPGLLPVRLMRAGAGASARWRAGFRGGRVGAAWESVVARGARPWSGEAREGVRGNPGFGGFPGFPWRLAVSWSGRCGAALAACAVHFSRSLARYVACVWGKTWNRAVVFGAGEVPGVPPVCFRIGPPPACLLVE